MRYHFFLHYGWFFQNLGKEAVRTFMHTTVPTQKSDVLYGRPHSILLLCMPAHTTKKFIQGDIIFYFMSSMST